MVKTYHPETLTEALKIRNETHALPYAGGTDLMVRYRQGPGLVPAFDREVMFIGHLPELTKLQEKNGEFAIGACVPYREIIHHRHTPEILRKACSLIGAPAVQNLGTMGGNICNASPAGDTLPPLAILDTHLTLQSVSGERQVSLLSFFTGPGKTILRDDELLIGIHFRLPHFTAEGYRKVGTRKANALSKVAFAAFMLKEKDMLADIRIALGAVAPTVVRSRELENRLIGQPLTDLANLMPDLLESYGTLIQPITDQRSDANYRKTVSLNLIENFVLKEES
ncbi:MAG: molybdopterin dehydrogenase [Acidobacteria bacterium]|nr:MAG: molybdopterin dehydrogenase [Acidobacteriota bacterium]